MTSSGGCTSTIPAQRDRPREKDRGLSVGKVKSCALVMRGDWRIRLSDKKEETDFTKSRACLAHNPATAGPRVQIPPPQPISPFWFSSAPSHPSRKDHLPPYRGWAKYTPRQSAGVTIQSSSVVERSAVNRLVVGSNPTSGATNPTRGSPGYRSSTPCSWVWSRYSSA